VKTSAMGVAAVVVLTLTACGPGNTETPYPIADQVLQGMINGEAWTFGVGRTNAFMSKDDTYWADLYAGSFTACTGAPAAGNHIIIAIPKLAGDYALGLSRNMTFVVPPSENYVGTTGRLIVKEVSTTTITASLHTFYGSASDGKFVVDGNFSATICP
jgi:hypothetical protein